MIDSRRRTAALPSPRDLLIAHVAADAHRDRALFVNFFTRELTTRYLGSSTGLAWAILHPLALLGVYHFVFTTVFRAGNFDGKSFLLFVAVALWPWLAAQEGAVARDGQPRRIRGSDPQGRLSAGDRRLRVGGARRSRCNSPATSSCWSR